VNRRHRRTPIAGNKRSTVAMNASVRATPNAWRLASNSAGVGKVPDNHWLTVNKPITIFSRSVTGTYVGFISNDSSPLLG